MPSVIIMIGSKNDDEYIKESQMCDLLDACGIDWEIWVLSAHRNLDETIEKSKAIAKSHLADLVIAAAGKTADLPKVVAAATDFSLLVIGVALPSTTHPDAEDAIEAMTGVPKGCPFLIASGTGSAALLHAAFSAASVLSSGPDVRSEMMRKSLGIYYQDKIRKDPTIPLRKSQKKEEEQSGD